MTNAADDARFACTPLVAAIRKRDNDAVNELLKSGVDLEEFISLEPETRKVVRTQGSMISGDDIGQTERYVGQPFDGVTNFERTPLLEACRHNNEEALCLLVAAGAKLNATDLLGETALSLCVYPTGARTEVLLDACIGNGQKLPVDEYLLGEFCRDPTLYRKVVEAGHLPAKAQHFRFCLNCALLDIDSVISELDTGYKINAKRPFELDPLREAACSELLRTFEHPLRAELAAGAIRVYETAPDDLLKVGSLNPSVQHIAQIEKRIALIELLVNRGLNVTALNPRDPFPLLGDIIAGNAPEILEKLLQIGVRFDPAELQEDGSIQTAIQWGCFDMVPALVNIGCPRPNVEEFWQDAFDHYLAWCGNQGIEPFSSEGAVEPGREKDTCVSFEPGCKAIRRSPARWQLAGESQLMAAVINDVAGRTVRLTYSNLYAPIDDVEIRLRLDGVDEWVAAELVEEIVNQDGDILMRSLAGETAGETPWDATFEAVVDAPAGLHDVDISIRSPREGIDTPIVIDDWKAKF